MSLAAAAAPAASQEKLTLSTVGCWLAGGRKVNEETGLRHRRSRLGNRVDHRELVL